MTVADPYSIDNLLSSLNSIDKSIAGYIPDAGVPVESTLDVHDVISTLRAIQSDLSWLNYPGETALIDISTDYSTSPSSSSDDDEWTSTSHSVLRERRIIFYDTTMIDSQCFDSPQAQLPAAKDELATFWNRLKLKAIFPDDSVHPHSPDLQIIEPCAQLPPQPWWEISVTDVADSSCAGCSTQFEDPGNTVFSFITQLTSPSSRRCEFSGKLFCNTCHIGEERPCITTLQTTGELRMRSACRAQANRVQWYERSLSWDDLAAATRHPRVRRLHWLRLVMGTLEFTEAAGAEFTTMPILYSPMDVADAINGVGLLAELNAIHSQVVKKVIDSLQYPERCIICDSNQPALVPFSALVSKCDFCNNYFHARCRKWSAGCPICFS